MEGVLLSYGGAVAWSFQRIGSFKLGFGDESCKEENGTYFCGKSIADFSNRGNGSRLIMGLFAHEHLPMSTLHVLVEDAKLLQAKSKQATFLDN